MTDIQDLQSFVNSQKEAVGKEDFNEGEQICYIEKFRLLGDRPDQVLKAVYTIRGAEEDNHEANYDLIFWIDPENPDSTKRWIRFLESINFNEPPNMGNLETQMSVLNGTVFKTKIWKKQGDSRIFINFTNIEVMDGEKLVEKENGEKKELPF